MKLPVAKLQFPNWACLELRESEQGLIFGVKHWKSVVPFFLGLAAVLLLISVFFGYFHSFKFGALLLGCSTFALLNLLVLWKHYLTGKAIFILNKNEWFFVGNDQVLISAPIIIEVFLDQGTRSGQITYVFIRLGENDLKLVFQVNITKPKKTIVESMCVKNHLSYEYISMKSKNELVEYINSQKRGKGDSGKR